jgi:uncharacterized membrane protein
MNMRLLGFSSLLHSSNMHPAFVHFPLALVPVSLILFAGGHLADSAGVRLAGRVCLWLALVSVMVAVFTGSKAVNDLPRGAAVFELMKAHRTLAFLTTFVTTLLAGWSTAHRKNRPRAIWFFLAVLALDCGLVFQTGDLGARMVYQHGADVKDAPSSAARGR